MSTTSSIHTNDDDYLLKRINNLSETEMRTILQHIALVHPDSVHSALKHVSHNCEDIHSVSTTPVNNLRTKKANESPHPVGHGGHPSKRNNKDIGEDDDDDAMPPPSSRGLRIEPHEKPSITESESSAFQPRQVDGPNNNYLLASDELNRVSLETSTVSAHTVETTGASQNPKGVCFLRYDPSGGGRLSIKYSKGDSAGASKNALASWVAQSPYVIPSFKFSGHATSELIGNCSSGVQGRKNFYSGWCQFIRLAKAMNGVVTILNETGLSGGVEVDLFAYSPSSSNSTCSKLGRSFSTGPLLAIACLPKHADFYHDMSIDLTKWMTQAATIGSAIMFEMKKRTSSVTPSVDSSRVSPPPRKLSPQQVQSKGTARSSRRFSARAVAADSPEIGAVTGACYLLYDSDSAKLVLQYSKTTLSSSPDILAMWTPGVNSRIQGFKFTQNHGRVDLIGNCASGVSGRKNFYSGCCQFLKYAHAMEGSIIFFDYVKGVTAGLPIDMYIYFDTKNQTRLLQSGQKYDLAINNERKLMAVACLPKLSKFYNHQMSVDINKWMTEAATLGAASRF